MAGRLLISRQICDSRSRIRRSSSTSSRFAIAVVRNARHRDQARAFVEYVGSIEAQLLATREAYRLAARRDIPIDSLPPWAREVRRTMKAADVDWDLLAAHGAEWMRTWDETVRGRGRARGGGHSQ